MNLTYKNREVEVSGTLEIGEGFYIECADFIDGPCEPLTESEIEELEQMYSSELYQDAYEHAACAAYDRMKGD